METQKRKWKQKEENEYEKKKIETKRIKWKRKEEN